MQLSPNFAFLKVHDLQLVRLGSQAERYFAEELLVVAEAEAAEIKAKLIGIQAQTVTQKSSVVQRSITNAQQNGRYLDLDERETRRLIDAQLRSAGWEADTEEMRYSQGTRPVQGRLIRQSI